MRKWRRVAGVVVVVVLLAGTGAVMWWRAGTTGEVAVERAGAEGVRGLREWGERVMRAEVTAGISGLLRELRGELRRVGPEEAGRWLSDEWQSGRDRETGGELVPGAGGVLVDWPSYRSFLLDEMLAADAGLAQRVAREVLGSEAAGADEWVVALRNLALRADGDGDRDLLQRGCRGLLVRADWQRDPGRGYLEGYDVLVHTGQVGMAGDLLRLTDGSAGKAVRHAAFLALDRLAERYPASMIPELGRLAGGPAGSGRMIAAMLARADVRDPVQVAALEEYLGAAGRTEAELDGFLDAFPSASKSLAEGLLTRPEPFRPEETRQRDLGARELLVQWMQKPSLQRIHDRMAAAVRRLDEWNASSGAGSSGK